MKSKKMWLDFTKYLYPLGLAVPRKIISLIKTPKKEKQIKQTSNFAVRH